MIYHEDHPAPNCVDGLPLDDVSSQPVADSCDLLSLGQALVIKVGR